uniref:Nuclear pore complex protein Nup98-Nup96 n=1 Tax=Rhabditophanes sp. KR3021 TaxID=114890 RepID=A0AC35TRW7_9BILA
MFGRNTFSNTNTTPNAFGSSGAFGSQQGTGFGTQNAAPAAGGFFGSASRPTSVFGSNAQAPATGGGMFGSAAPQSSGGMFGSNTQTNTGSIFGSTNTQGTLGGGGMSGFGGTGTSIFGSSTNTQNTGGGMFGSSGFGTTTPVVGSTVKFEPKIEDDSMIRNGKTESIKTKIMCLTAMKEYETKCVEEIRVEDYKANRKTGTSTTSGFGVQAAPSTGGLFGSTNASSGSGLFGSPAAQQKPTSLFGSSQASSGTLFGSNANTGATGGMFGSNTAGTSSGSSLFGAKPAGTSLFGATQAAPSAFGSTQTGAFGSTQAPTTAFGAGASTSASASLFGNKPAFGATTGSSLFGSAAPAASNTFGAANNAFGFGSTNTAPAQPAATGGFGFGNTAAANTSGSSLFGAKPAAAAAPFSGFGAAPTNAFGTAAPATGLFGSTAPAKPSLFSAPAATGGSLFGTPSTNTGGGLFGSTQPPATNQLFGQQPALQSSFNQAPAAAPQVVHQSIVIGGDVNQTALQQALIDAQIAASPYGYSPLLQMSYKKEDKDKDGPLHSTTPLSIQRQNKFLASKTVQGDEVKLAPVNKSLACPVAQKSGNKSGLQYKSYFSPKVSNDSLVYKDKSMNRTNPLLMNLSSTSDMNNTSGNVSSIMNHSLTKSSSGRLGNLKKVDAHLVHNLLKPVTPGRDAERPETPVNVPTDSHHPLSHSTPHDANGIINNDRSAMSDGTNKTGSSFEHSRGEMPSVVENESMEEAKTHPAGIIMANPDYHMQPSLENLAKNVVNGRALIKKGLKISRQGYGSVFWPGSFELHDTNIDDVVLFRNREVTVYPDDECKPQLGQGLNRPAEISLEHVWPLDQESKAYITDVKKLEEMKFRDRLERVTLKNEGTFLDYKPSTGTWIFKVKHFSRYAFDDNDENDASVAKKPKLDKDNGNQIRTFAKDMANKRFDDQEMMMSEDCHESFYEEGEIMNLQENNISTSFHDFKNINDSSVCFGSKFEMEYSTVPKKMKMSELLECSELLFPNNHHAEQKVIQMETTLYEDEMNVIEQMETRTPKNKLPFIGTKESITQLAGPNFVDAALFMGNKTKSYLWKNSIFMNDSNTSLVQIDLVDGDQLEKSALVSKKLLAINRKFSSEANNGQIKKIKVPSKTSEVMNEYVATIKSAPGLDLTEEVSLYKLLLAYSDANNKKELLEEIKYWFSNEAASEGETRELKEYKLIFGYLCEGNTQKAVDTALDMNELSLAMALSSHGMNVRKDENACKLFLDQLTQTKLSGNYDIYLIKIYMILCGVYKQAYGRGKTIRWDDKLGWKKAFGLVLFYMNGKGSSVKTVLKDFIKNGSCSIEGNDISMAVLKVITGCEADLSTIIKPLLSFSKFEDYRLW